MIALSGALIDHFFAPFLMNGALACTQSAPGTSRLANGNQQHHSAESIDSLAEELSFLNSPAGYQPITVGGGIKRMLIQRTDIEIKAEAETTNHEEENTLPSSLVIDSFGTGSTPRWWSLVPVDSCFLV